MSGLFETKLQKFILLLGGFFIFLRLINVSYYTRWETILSSLGIAILTIVLLVILKDYKTDLHIKIWNFIKRNKSWFYAVIAIFVLFFALHEYSKVDAQIKFHRSEILYQNCLDKIANQNRKIENDVSNYININLSRLPKLNNLFECIINNDPNCPAEHVKYNSDIEQINKQSYFYQWSEANRPGFNDKTGFWEVYFMNWMMQNHPDFCSEYNSSSITSFVNTKLDQITKK